MWGVICEIKVDRETWTVSRALHVSPGEWEVCAGAEGPVRQGWQSARESYRTEVGSRENPERINRIKGRWRECRRCYQKLTGSCSAVRGRSVLKKEVCKCQGNS